MASKLDSLGYNLNSNVKESKPLIQLHVDHNVHSPVVLRRTNKSDSLEFVIFIANVKSAVAYNLRNSMVALSPEGDTSFQIEFSNYNLFNETISLSNSYAMGVKRSMYYAPDLDTGYIYFKIDYTDINKIPQVPFRVLYLITPQLIDKQLKPVDELKFLQMKSFLQKNNLWN